MAREKMAHKKMAHEKTAHEKAGSQEHAGERPMEMWYDQQKPLQQRTSNELVKLIRKLRWIGMEEEAESVQHELSERHVAADSVVASPRDTD
jgi:hypothetical protein